MPGNRCVLGQTPQLGIFFRALTKEVEKDLLACPVDPFSRSEKTQRR